MSKHTQSADENFSFDMRFLNYIRTLSAVECHGYLTQKQHTTLIMQPVAARTTQIHKAR
jgi:hypothetical protein